MRNHFYLDILSGKFKYKRFEDEKIVKEGFSMRIHRLDLFSIQHLFKKVSKKFTNPTSKNYSFAKLSFMS